MAACWSEVRLWDAMAGTVLFAPLRHDAAVEWAAFSRDGTLLVSTAGRHVFLWDMATGRPWPVRSIIPTWSTMWLSPRMAAAWSFPTADPTWESAVPGSGTYLSATRNPRIRLEHYDDVYQAEYSPDGRRIITVSYDRSVKLWDAATGELADDSQAR